MKKNFYNELIENIEKKISENNYSFALELINSELKMPYIPIKIENKLIELKQFIESIIFDKNNKALSIGNITLLLRNEKIGLMEKSEIVNLLESFNVKNDLIFEFLEDKETDFFLKMKILSILKKQTEFKDIKVNLKNKTYIVNSIDLFDVDTNKNFASDSKVIEEFLFKQPILLENALSILEKYYFIEFFSNKNISNVAFEIVFIVSKLFDELEIQQKILKNSKINMSNFEQNVIKILNLTKY